MNYVILFVSLVDLLLGQMLIMFKIVLCDCLAYNQLRGQDGTDQRKFVQQINQEMCLGPNRCGATTQLSIRPERLGRTHQFEKEVSTLVLALCTLTVAL